MAETQETIETTFIPEAAIKTEIDYDPDQIVEQVEDAQGNIFNIYSDIVQPKEEPIDNSYDPQLENRLQQQVSNITSTTKTYDLRNNIKSEPPTPPGSNKPKNVVPQQTSTPFPQKNVKVYKQINKLYYCVNCSAAFAMKESLVDHEIEAHLDIKQFECDQCPKAFLYRSLLNEHKRTHLRKRLIKCDDCQKTFRLKGDLAKHQKEVHREMKPFQCDECPKGFSHRTTLNKHKLTHISEHS